MTTASIRLASSLLGLGLLLSACGTGSAASGDPQAEAGRQARLTRVALVDAREAARPFGQAHLGHYLKMTVADLEREGAEIPAEIGLEVETTHMTYCIEAANDALPSIHPWAKATIASTDVAPSRSDRCHL